MKLIIIVLLSALSFSASAVSYLGSPFPNSADAKEIEGLLTDLAERQGLHVVVNLEPSIYRHSWMQDRDVIKKLEALKFNSAIPEQRNKLARYIARQDNACVAQTLRSINELLGRWDNAQYITDLTQKTYDSIEPGAGKPSLSDYQTVYVDIEVQEIRAYMPEADAIQNLIDYGWEPGTKGVPVSDDFDYSRIAYTLPVRRLDVSARSWVKLEKDGSYFMQIRREEIENWRFEDPTKANFMDKLRCSSPDIRGLFDHVNGVKRQCVYPGATSYVIGGDNDCVK